MICCGPKRLFSRAARGALGLVGSVAKPAPSWVVERRRSICRECPLRKGAFCSECHCLLIAKTRVVDERCPLHKWESSVSPSP